MKRAPRELITIERNTPALNARGEFADAWSVVGTTWADMHQINGREREAAEQVRSEATWRAYTRWIPGLAIRPSDRIRYEQRVYEIEAVIDLHERHHTIQLDLKEVA